jgi:hypothetical protein
LSANGSSPTPEAIAQAEADALAHQDAHPPVTPPPAQPEPEAPAQPVLYSPEWWTQIIPQNEANLRQQQANVAALRKQLREAEDAEQRIIGVLDTLRALQQMGARE